MSASIPYIPGHLPSNPGPLARFLPPLPEGVATIWLKDNLPPGSWVLDPFGAAPRLAVEVARAGYRLLVTANNPIVRFLLEMTADPPKEADLRASLAELASARKGEDRLEPFIRSLYLTRCDQCSQEIMASAFLWDRSVKSSVPGVASGEQLGKIGAPFARVYKCSNCGKRGERPTTEADLSRAAQFSTTGLHRARALERIAPRGDPDRSHVEEALATYVPRALLALFTLINKLDGLHISPIRRRHLEALLLTAFDRANTLWPYPTARERPRKLTIPPRFRENNIWLALEQAIKAWALEGPSVPLSIWPEVPPSQGGIALFEGRLKDLGQLQTLANHQIGAVLTAFPRPNQAFWTLSALWAGWLWGREAIGPFKSVLRRRRYDWAWHSTALHAVLESLHLHLDPGTSCFGLIGEVETGFLSATLIAADSAKFALHRLALRPESGQAQISWQMTSERDKEFKGIKPDRLGFARQAARSYLRERGEPSSYLHLHAAVLSALVHSHSLTTTIEPKSGELIPPAETLSQINSTFDDAFGYRGGFLRYGGSEKSLEVGQWWLRESSNAATPLSDRVENALVHYLLEHPASTLLQIDSALCAAFPTEKGEPITPNPKLIQVCLESYGEQDPPKSGHWCIRKEDSPEARRAEFSAITHLLEQIGSRLDFFPGGQKPLLWREKGGEIKYIFYVITSAVFGEIILAGEFPAQQSWIVLPGGRANLVAYKLRRDPRLRQVIEEGWRFIKFRHVRWLAESPILNRDLLDEQLDLDTLTYDVPQLRLL